MWATTFESSFCFSLNSFSRGVIDALLNVRIAWFCSRSNLHVFLSTNQKSALFFWLPIKNQHIFWPPIWFSPKLAPFFWPYQKSVLFLTGEVGVGWVFRGLGRRVVTTPHTIWIECVGGRGVECVGWRWAGEWVGGGCGVGASPTLCQWE